MHIIYIMYGCAGVCDRVVLCWWSHVHVCVCVCCAVPQLAEVMVWIMMLLFFAIWPCGFSLCSVVSKIHKGTLGLSVFECLHVCVRVFVCVHLLCGSFMTVLFFLLTVWFWSNAACSINLTYKVINPAFSSFFLSRFLCLFLSLFFFSHNHFPIWPEAFLYFFWSPHPMIWTTKHQLLSDSLAVQKPVQIQFSVSVECTLLQGAAHVLRWWYKTVKMLILLGIMGI